MAQAYITKEYKGHTIGLVNGCDDKKVWGDFPQVDGKVYRFVVFTDPLRAWAAAEWIVDNMLKDEAE